MIEENNKTTANVKYKDRLFNFLFGSPENKKWTLSLYNAVNGSAYTDENAIEINTIKEALYLGMHNDTSFMISDTINIYEHQSSFNPNMPLRQLQYLGSLYEKYIKENELNKYSSTLLQLPVPKLVVFYNGIRDKQDEIILNLSDSFDERVRAEADVEVRVRMLNVNYGHNQKILDVCRPLNEYAWYIDTVRQYHRTMEIESALSRAIDDMPKDFTIRQFMMIHKSEVFSMLLCEYNEEETMNLFKKEGIQEGLQQGQMQHLVEQVCKKLRKSKTAAEISEELEEDLDEITRICQVADKYAPEYNVNSIMENL